MAALALLALPGCGTPDATPAPSTAGAPSAAPSGPATATPTKQPTATPTTTPTNRPAHPETGVDVSHHSGPIDWPRVRRAGMTFAYLKATEGSGYTDPTFAANRAAARAAGLRVGGYHYFSICSPAAPQAEHFAAVVGRAALPPALDIELDPDCDPSRADLLAAAQEWIRVVEDATGQRVLVYVYPDLEARYGLRRDLDRPLWVRRLGDVPPSGQWTLWQRSDSARVDGIGGGVDVNQFRRP